MKILIEEYRYDASLVRKYLHDIDELDVVEGFVSELCGLLLQQLT